MSAIVVVSADHLDLLITAAVRYGVLVNPTRAKFTTAPGVAASPTDAGKLLLEQSLAAASAFTTPAETARVLDPELMDYEHVPVVRVNPVEVLNASRSPRWSYSTARHLILDLIRASIEHLPGYATAPRTWSRPPVRTGAPIGLRRQWIPIDTGVQWLSPNEFATRWDTATLVLLTLDALIDLPTGLARRDAVYVIAGDTVTAADWAAIAQSPSLLLVQLPAGREWLHNELDAAGALGYPRRPARPCAIRRRRLCPRSPPRRVAVHIMFLAGFGQPRRSPPSIRR